MVPNQQAINQPVSKVRQLQQRVTVTATPRISPANQPQHGANSPSFSNNMQIRQVNSNTAMHYRAGDLHALSGHESKLKLSESAPAGTLKRAYDKLNTAPLPREELNRRPAIEQQTSHFNQNSTHNSLSSSAQDPLMGLSPRKKPRKQTHIIAEGLCFIKKM